MNETEIDRLLRQQAPELAVPLGLDAKISARLRNEAKSRRLSPAWIALPIAAMLTLAIYLAAEKPSIPAEFVETIEGPPELELESEFVVNPLRDEARALKNNAERTGRFLFDCLPALSQVE